MSTFLDERITSVLLDVPAYESGYPQLPQYVGPPVLSGEFVTGHDGPVPTLCPAPRGCRGSLVWERACADMPRIDAYLATLDQDLLVRPSSSTACFMARYVAEVLLYRGPVSVGISHIQWRDNLTNVMYFVPLSPANTAWQLAMINDLRTDVDPVVDTVLNRANMGFIYYLHRRDSLSVQRARQLLAPHLV